jgi:hypothetical protein
MGFNKRKMEDRRRQAAIGASAAPAECLHSRFALLNTASSTKR